MKGGEIKWGICDKYFVLWMILSHFIFFYFLFFYMCVRETVVSRLACVTLTIPSVPGYPLGSPRVAFLLRFLRFSVKKNKNILQCT